MGVERGLHMRHGIKSYIVLAESLNIGLAANFPHNLTRNTPSPSHVDTCTPHGVRVPHLGVDTMGLQHAFGERGDPFSTYRFTGSQTRPNKGLCLLRALVQQRRSKICIYQQQMPRTSDKVRKERQILFASVIRPSLTLSQYTAFAIHLRHHAERAASLHSVMTRIGARQLAAYHELEAVPALRKGLQDLMEAKGRQVQKNQQRRLAIPSGLRGTCSQVTQRARQLRHPPSLHLYTSLWQHGHSPLKRSIVPPD